jgi:NADH-quinone oxidoreductase subunit L
VVGVAEVELTVVREPFLPWSLAWLAPYIASAVMGVLWLYGYRRDLVYGLLAVAGILVSALTSTAIALRVFGEGVAVHVGADSLWIPWLGVGAGSFFDGLSTAMALVVSWVSLLIAVYSLKYMEGDPGYARYFFMFSFFVGSMMLLVVADNLVLMFIGWEGTGIASYALIGHWYTDEEEYWVGRPGRRVLGTPMYFEPSHSAVRAILFTRIGDIGLLIGIAALYLYAGTFSIPELAGTAAGWMASLAADGILAPLLLVLTLGAFAKSAQFPFHEWLVTAMTGPTPVSALIHAATMVKAGVFLVLRLTPILLAGYAALGGQVAGHLEAYFTVVAWIAVATALLLSIMALVADELKLILAYSTASQLGYMMLAAAAAGLAAVYGRLEPLEAAGEGVAAGFSHLASHAVFKAALFLAAGWLIHVAHSRFIDSMGGYARYMKLTALSFWLAGLSLAGVPPLSGFFTKEAVIDVAFKASTMLGLLAAATAAFTAAYIVRAAVRIFHLPPYEEGHGGHRPGEAPPLMLAPYLILSLAALAMGLGYQQLFAALARASALTLSAAEAVIKVVLTKPLTLGVLGGVAASIALVIILYMVLRVDFRRLVRESRAAAAIHGFLYDRMYVNPVIYLVFVGGGAWMARSMLELDMTIDFLYHAALVAVAAGAAGALRLASRGRTDYLLALYLLGLAAALGYALVAARSYLLGLIP